MNLNEAPHKRYNSLNGEWIIVSPHRTKRPWQGKQEAPSTTIRPEHDESCYLCPTNTRADGSINPDYPSSYAFTNDFSALLPEKENETSYSEADLLKAEHVRGLCRVVCFSPRHDLTLAQMETKDIVPVIQLWQREFAEISKLDWIRNILIFENKGEIMGCSNPHPHGQIWAQGDLPAELEKESTQQLKYFNVHGKTLLSNYLELEIKLEKRIVCTNDHFVALVPFWATWPFETIIIGKTPRKNITEFSAEEVLGLADILKKLTVKYDNLFKTSFPYSAGMHQAPVNDGEHSEWQWHMHFYPPLLRSASVKKFMVGYELLASPQRDITAESAAERLREVPEIHYELNQN
jgi:UDPglucose--hexose-1-phosphate uridylyltransferase